MLDDRKLGNNMIIYEETCSQRIFRLQKRQNLYSALQITHTILKHDLF